MDLAIEIKDLNHSFGKKIICNNMNINFEYGKIYGLLGRNGTGKSTLINFSFFVGNGTNDVPFFIYRCKIELYTVILLPKNSIFAPSFKF